MAKKQQSTKTPTNNTNEVVDANNTTTTTSASTSAAVATDNGSTAVSSSGATNEQSAAPERALIVNTTSRDIIFWSTDGSQFKFYRGAGIYYDSIPEWVIKHSDFRSLRAVGSLTTMVESFFKQWLEQRRKANTNERNLIV